MCGCEVVDSRGIKLQVDGFLVPAYARCGQSTKRSVAMLLHLFLTSSSASLLHLREVASPWH